MNSMFWSTAVFSASLAITTSLAAAPSPAQVDDLLNTYYTVQTLLASDDLAAAKTAASALSEQAARAGALAELATAAARVAEAARIKVARMRFQPVSTHMQALVESVGTGGETVYVALCPMAFDRGGTWLQDSPRIANPYWGTLMPRCGRVTKRIGDNPGGER